MFALNFLYVFLLGIFQATRPRSSGRELVQCAAFAIYFRFEIFVCVSPGDLSGDAPKILRSGTCTVCRVRDEFSLWIFWMCFSWHLWGGAFKSSSKELVPCRSTCVYAPNEESGRRSSKKGDRQKEENYRPITSLIAVDKIFEKLLNAQVTVKLDPTLYSRMAAYRKRHSCETTPIRLIEGLEGSHEQSKEQHEQSKVRRH